MSDQELAVWYNDNDNDTVDFDVDFLETLRVQASGA